MISKRLKSARLAAGMSQADLAKAAGLSQPFITQVERGIKQPSVDTVRDLARVLGIAPGFLFGQSQYDLAQAYDTDPRQAMIDDQETPPGLRALADDETLCAALKVVDWEWQALRSLDISVYPTREGYLLLLHALRAARLM